MWAPSIVFLLGIVSLLASCATVDDSESLPRTLAEFRFSAMASEGLLGLQPEPHLGLQRLLDGWEEPRRDIEALWTMGPSAAIRLRCVGRGATLAIRCSTSPEHVALGQRLVVSWDGRPVGSAEFTQGWTTQEFSVELPDSVFAEGWSVLRLEPSATIERRGVFIESIRLTARLGAVELERWDSVSEPPPPDPSWQRHAFEPANVSRNAPLPHVLVLLLDAARVDHFSSYGYARQTTPFIDGLASGGVLLRQLFAEAPYTRNSVATLMSSLSWRDHQVLGVEDALAPEAVTLAEILRAAGYATRGISDSVQASQASGVDQGFEEFTETWRERKNAWRPEIVLDAFERMRQELPPDRPAFVYVHILPPHEPYDPGPFDRWGPKDSDVVGSSLNIVEFDKGIRPTAGPAHERLVARYDGGLRRGDEIVRRLVESWQPTERPVWVVVLSDHAEAFGEHDRYGHNSTVFDEMLRVPGIFWPQRSFDFLIGNEGALRSLADVAPILLRALAIEPVAGIWPARFQEVLRAPERGRKEIFCMAVGQRFGVRTSDGLLLLYRAKDHLELHAVEPEWTKTRLLNATDRENELRLRLVSFVGNAQPSSATHGALSEEARRELEALGYL
jgi:hypothetical protein